MKKLLLSLVALMTFGVSAWADGVIVPDIQVPQGKSGIIKIKLNAETGYYKGIALEVNVPEKVTCDEMTFKQQTGTDEETGKPIFVDATGPKAVVGTDLASTFSIASNYVEENTQSWRFLVFEANGVFVNEELGEYEVLQIPVNVDASVTPGTVLDATITNIHFSNGADKDIPFSDVSFKIEVVEDVMILDENSTTPPEIAENQNVLVKRTIKAGNWSTICLPFATTATQLSEAFSEACGEEVQVELADFAGYETTEDANSETVGITVNFNSITAIEANHPCIIKVSSDISEFSLDGVDINPEEDPTVAAVKRTKKQWSELIGTYTTKEIGTDGHVLFLSGNKFWYATSSKQMKGYRAYFDFYDELAEVEGAGVKMFIDGTPTSISDIDFVTAPEGVFTIDGKKMNNDVTKLPKGVYIIDGKKVAIK